MELKDVILSTLAEMEDAGSNKSDSKPINNTDSIPKKEIQLNRAQNEPTVENKPAVEIPEEKSCSENEMIFLTSMRERLLVLFEGFQAPNNTNIEAKVDMTLNFLEYVLVTIDSRVHELEKKAIK